jgi:hypothetical protein
MLAEEGSFFMGPLALNGELFTGPPMLKGDGSLFMVEAEVSLHGEAKGLVDDGANLLCSGLMYDLWLEGARKVPSRFSIAWLDDWPNCGRFELEPD